jgi:multidrug efflux pump
VLFSQIQLPTGATQERTLKVIEKVEDHFMNDEKNAVASVFAVAGFSFAAMARTAASPSCA